MATVWLQFDKVSVTEEHRRFQAAVATPATNDRCRHCLAIFVDITRKVDAKGVQGRITVNAAERARPGAKSDLLGKDDLLTVGAQRAPHDDDTYGPGEGSAVIQRNACNIRETVGADCGGWNFENPGGELGHCCISFLR
jgi:hypothetical protein